MITKTNLILFNIYLIAFKHPFPNIKWFYTSKSEIENTIKLIKTQNCCGYNKIHIKIPKKSAPFITSHLTCVFNKHRSSGVFSDRLKFLQSNKCVKININSSPPITDLYL